MSLLVLKFGSASVSSIDRIKNAASKVAQEVRRGNRVVVVVSAMAGVRGHLINFCQGISSRCNPREYDVVVSTGEQVSAGLMAMALEQRGLNARSWLAWQLPIRTDTAHKKGRIEEIDTTELEACLEKGIIPVIAGFQGVSKDHEITTLGEGGSDTSAVAMAAALGAARCDIYTDMKGIYTAAPHIVRQAQKVSRISYKEMLELTALGAEDMEVLQPRSIEIGLQYHVPVQILSTFENDIGSDLPGTLVKTEDPTMETKPVTGIAHSRKFAKITLADIPDRPGIAATVFGSISRAGINVDAIVQTASGTGDITDITFTVNREDMKRAEELLISEQEKIGFKKIFTNDAIAKVSLVGLGMRSRPGVAAQMFQTLADENINIQAVETSEITTSVIIAEDYLELALRALHTSFHLNPAD